MQLAIVVSLSVPEPSVPLSPRSGLHRARSLARLDERRRLEQPDDLAVGADVDRIGRRHLRQARHGHDLTADRHDELGAGGEPHFAHRDV